jgi:hypothetical protein
MAAVSRCRSYRRSKFIDEGGFYRRGVPEAVSNEAAAVEEASKAGYEREVGRAKVRSAKSEEQLKPCRTVPCRAVPCRAVP